MFKGAFLCSSTMNPGESTLNEAPARLQCVFMLCPVVYLLHTVIKDLFITLLLILLWPNSVLHIFS